MPRACSSSGPRRAFDDRRVRDLPDLLAPGDVLVLNDTKVIPSRLHGLRVRGEAAARVEIMLHKREGADRWRAFARPAKKLAHRRPHPLRRGGREHGLRARAPRRRGRGEGRGRRGPAALRLCRPGPRRGDRAVRRAAAAALHRRQAPDRRRGRASTTRPSTPGTKAPSRRRPPACTSPTSSSAVSTTAASRANS